MVLKLILLDKDVYQRMRDICLSIPYFRMDRYGLDREKTYNYIYYIFLTKTGIKSEFPYIDHVHNPTTCQIKVDERLVDEMKDYMKKMKKIHQIKSQYSTIFDFFNRYIQENVPESSYNSFKPEQAFYDYMELLI